MSTGQQSLRKAIGAIKDSTTVGLAKVNSEYKEIDIAIVKATYHDEILSKEKHIRTILQSLSSSRPRTDVFYCLQALGRRLAKTRNWAVALKTLIIIHRAMREVDTSIREELVNFRKIKNHMLNLSHFKDDSSRNAWDCAAWVRNYALYLEERLECFRLLKYDVQNDNLKTKELDTPELLNHLPPLQLLLFRLVCCRPGGAARFNCLIQYALSIVAAESVKIYVAITDGVLRLVDKFFQMRQYDAVRALDIYRKSADQAEWLSEFFEMCRALDFGRGQDYIKIEKPPATFIISMEEYVKEAPHKLALPWRENEDENSGSPREIVADSSNHKEGIGPEEKSDASLISLEAPESGNSNEDSKAVAAPPIVDLLGFDDLTLEASEQRDENALALAIVNTENPPSSSSSSTLAYSSDSWELALFTAPPSSNEAAVAQSKLVGGLDRLALDSLYDNAMANTNQNIGNYHTGEVVVNPFETMGLNQDPFSVPGNMVPQNNMQMVTMGQQQEAFLGGLYQYQQSQPVTNHVPTSSSGNPFLDHDLSPHSAHNCDVSPYQTQIIGGSPYHQAESIGGSPYQVQSAGGSPYPVQSPDVFHYAAQSSNGSPFLGQTSAVTSFPGQAPGVSPYPGQTPGGFPHPAQSLGDSPFPSQSQVTSPFPGQSPGQIPGGSPNPAKCLGDLRIPSQCQDGTPFPQTPGDSSFPGQRAGTVPNPAQNQGVSANAAPNHDPFADLIQR